MTTFQKLIWFFGGIAAILAVNWVCEALFLPAKPTPPVAPVKLLVAHSTSMLAAAAALEEKRIR